MGLKPPAFDVIVVGGGPAGVTAALRAAELGARVALVERNRLGGTCTNDGCVPARVLAHAARLARDAEQFGDYGLIGTPPAVDFAAVLARVQRVIELVHAKKDLPGYLARAGVATFVDAGEARFADPHHLVLGNGETLAGKKFILCAGGHARRLTFPGSEYALTPTGVWSLRELPQSIVIVGGAATGCQLASVFAAFGARVTLLEAASRLLPGEDLDVSNAIHAAFAERGIVVQTGVGAIRSIDRPDGMLRVNYAYDGLAQTAAAGAVVLSVGWPGNAGALGLGAAGVRAEHGYIRVDETLRTSAQHVFAAGDVTGRMMLVQAADYEARIAAENAVLGTTAGLDHHIVPHGGFTDPEYGGVGMTEDQARAAHDVAVGTVPYTDLDRAVIDGHMAGFCKLIVDRHTQRLLGAHVVGEQAVEVVQVAAAGMAAGMTLEQFATLQLAYPTYCAIVGRVARKLLRELGAALPAEWRVLGGARSDA